MRPLMTSLGLVLAATALAGCSSSSGAEASDSPSAAVASTAADAPSMEAAAPPGAGSATLVVGETTYEFDNFQCAFGYSNTMSDTFSFSSNSLQVIDGVRVQMQLDVADRSGSDSLTGEAVVQEISVNDVEDFENPAISIRTTSLDATFDGDTISAEGTFIDEAADSSAELPGSFEATCGAGTLR